MRVVNFESLKLQERAHARGGIFRYYELLSGSDGAPDNFYLQLSVLSGDFVSPRHRHNFDQVRFQLEGSFDFAADGRKDPGSIAYFPEGTRYGPQQALSPSSATLVLQFGGASGNGYMSEAQFQQGLAEMKQGPGTFANGIYTQEKPGGGKINQDAYEAVWEHVNGRDLAYPKERYSHAVFMEPANFDWLPGAPGLASKLMGVFSERGSRLHFHRMDAGSRMALEDGSLYFVCAGAGEVAGKHYSPRTTIHVEHGELADLRAADATEVLQIGLPRFATATAQRAAA